MGVGESVSSIKIDDKSTVPIFQQIVDEIERLVLIGELKPGEFVPSVRELAVKHAVNPNTVAKSYGSLQASGIIETVRGTGLRVTTQPSASLEKRRHELLTAKARALVDEGSALGFDLNEIVDAVQVAKNTRRES